MTNESSFPTEAERSRSAAACPAFRRNPEIVEHHLFVVNIYKRTSTDKWFHTISKDAMRVAQSQDYDTKQEAIDTVKLKN